MFKFLAGLLVIAALAVGAFYGSAWLWSPDAGNAGFIALVCVIAVPVIILFVVVVANLKFDPDFTITTGFDTNGDGVKDIFFSRRVK